MSNKSVMDDNFFYIFLQMLVYLDLKTAQTTAPAILNWLR